MDQHQQSLVRHESCVRRAEIILLRRRLNPAEEPFLWRAVYEYLKKCSNKEQTPDGSIFNP